jgi:FAD:protein FMN transferase
VGRSHRRGAGWTRTWAAALVLWLSGVPAVPAQDQAYPDFVEEVYLTPEEALKLAFPDAERLEKDVVKLGPAQKTRVEQRLGWRLEQSSYTVHRGFADGRPAGYAVIIEEIGKYKPITFLVKATPDFQVDRVDVLVYREPRGGEVRKRRFLHQFRGKTAQSPLRINRDIINITGATLSVRAMSAGVKRVLAVLEEAYKEKK